MKLPAEADDGAKSKALRLIIPVAFIALVTMAGIFLFEQISIKYFHDFTLLESHVFTIVAAGILTAIASLLVILRFESLYSRALKENSERKRAEKELEGAKAQVELYMDLLSHDINNMNTAALGFLEMARDKLESTGMLDRDDEPLIEKPVNNLINSSKLIENVRKLQREKSGALPLKPIGLWAVLSSVKDEYANVPGRDVRINLDKTCDCTVMANELLRDVFSNLVGNAIKHSSGALTVNVGLTCRNEDKARFCQVTVEDNGPGVPDDEKSAILYRSLRGRPGRDRGLGLYIVTTLVDDFHGRIWVEDRVPGDFARGARFVVVLPEVQDL